jgi:hypothetical protein
MFIHLAAETAPAGPLEIVTDEARVQRLAVAALALSQHRLMVEVREGDCLMFSLDRNGVQWTRPQARASTEGSAECFPTVPDRW